MFFNVWQACGFALAGDRILEEAAEQAWPADIEDEGEMSGRVKSGSAEYNGKVLVKSAHSKRRFKGCGLGSNHTVPRVMAFRLQ